MLPHPRRCAVPRLGENCYIPGMDDVIDPAGRTEALFPGAGERAIAAGRGWRLREFRCTAGPGDRIFEERHEAVTIAFVREGHFRYRSSTGAAALYPGALLLGDAGACYECGHEHGTGDLCLSLNLDPGFFAEIAASAAGVSRSTFPAPALPAASDWLPALVRLEAACVGSQVAARDEAVIQFAEAVLGAAWHAAPSAVPASARERRRLREVLDFIILNAGEPQGIDDLAALAGMSKYHFLRVFRAVFGTTPYRYLLDLRLRNAAADLAAGDRPVSAIAYEAGFGDLSTFNARFRKVFGASPSAFRREIRTRRDLRP